MKITIVGAGNMSSALVKQLSKAGHEIRITSREISKAQALASNNSRVTAVPAAQAVGASDIVIIATAYADAVPALRSLGDLSGKIVIDISNPLSTDYMSLSIGHTTSAAEEIAAALTGVAVVKAFNTVFAQVLATGPSLDGQLVPVLYATDNERARQTIQALI